MEHVPPPTSVTLSLRKKLVHAAKVLVAVLNTADDTQRYVEFLHEVLLRCHCYKEEGESLLPNIIVTTELPASAVSIRSLDVTTLGRDNANQFLKEAAPLCGSTLSLYLNLSQKGINYGVCSDKATSSRSIHVVSVGAVIVHSPDQKYLIDFLCQFPEDMESYDEYRGELSKLLQLFPPVRGTVVKNAIKIAQKSHGFLIAVADPDRAVKAFIHEQATNGDWVPVRIADDLDPLDPLDPNSSVKVILTELLTKFLSSDGITVLNLDGHPIGFRGFSYLPAGQSSNEPVVGGARKRAFKALRHYVDAGILKAAFYQSQDGPSQFYMAAQAAPDTDRPAPDADRPPPGPAPDADRPPPGPAPDTDRPPAGPVAATCKLRPAGGPTPVWVYVKATKSLRDVKEVVLSFEGGSTHTASLHLYSDYSAGFQLEDCPVGRISVLIGVLRARYTVYDVPGRPIVSSCSPYPGRNWTFIDGANFLPGCKVRLPDGRDLSTYFYSQNRVGVEVPDAQPLTTFVLETKQGEFKFTSEH